MMVESFLPAMRMLVTRRLREEGFSQGKIASLLGLTQASVSLYLFADDAVEVARLAMRIARVFSETY
jgi:predicted transcriptional regulator